MSTLERIFHAVLFEVLAVSFSIIGLAVLTEHPISALSWTMIAIATTAMIWNYIFNLVFDRFVTGEKVERTFRTRLIHVTLFELGLLFATIPLMAYLLNVSLWDAFIMDIGVTLFITCYAFAFNFIYDHTRAAIVRRRATAI